MKVSETASPSPSVSRPSPERRRQSRRTVEAEVRLYPAGQPALEFHGQLLDYSAQGFRAAHRQLLLSTGVEVQFHHFRAEGRARVVWNRICSGQVESGFLILPDDPPHSA